MEQKRSITRYFVYLMVACLAINLTLSRLMLLFAIPLYLDSVGTVLAAIVGGYLPAIIVGFLTNLINGISDPITLYYGIISILIAGAASFLAKRNWFRSFGKTLLSVAVFTFIGGGLGSGLTWLLYGFSFGSGITAPFAILLHEVVGLGEFASQLTADLAIDAIDKLITVLVCYLVFKALPRSLAARFPDGHLLPAAVDASPPVQKRRGLLVGHSLRSKVAGMIALSAFVLGCLATTISYILYSNTMTSHYIETASSIADLEAETVDAERVDFYLSTGVKDEAYLATEAVLQSLRDNTPDIEYIYVYQVHADGCRVLFDTDTPDLEGGELGSLVPIEPAFKPYLNDLRAGNEIPPIVSNGSYGWLLTVYKPIRNAAGRCVAYAAADVSMSDVVTDRAVFIIKMVSLLFGASVSLVVFALWFAERRLVDPINVMARAAGEFAFDSERERAVTTARLRSLDVHTGDEIENLCEALKKTGADISVYIADVQRKTDVISEMRSNIILSFADLVENRDRSTGEHIKHTAAYVRAIAEELLRRGYCPTLLDADYVNVIVRCAPLHDLGKIRIPDAILNKPGRLTPEEFEQIKTHTTAGRDIINSILNNVSERGYLSEAADIAAYHHERWGGAGYPEGRSGTGIPLSARIMAVADVYDALISKRSYKEALTHEEALVIIREGAGTHFDPDVVDAFLTALPALLTKP